MTALGTALAVAVALTASPLVIPAGGAADRLDVLGPLVRPALTRQLPPHLRGVLLLAGDFGARAALGVYRERMIKAQAKHLDFFKQRMRAE